jgi:hypothetical protein
MVDEVKLELELISFVFFALITISPSLHTHQSPPHEVCDSPDQAEHHTLGPELETVTEWQGRVGL